MGNLTYSLIRSKAMQMRADASTMLRDGIETYLKNFKLEKESPYFYENVADLYQNYKDDIFEADIIEAFENEIYFIVNDISSKQLLEHIRKLDVVDVLIDLRFESSLQYLKKLPTAKITEVIIALQRILTKSYWNMEE